MFIIAECGSNWSTIDDCITSISNAKACGADAVKFQLFSSHELYGSNIRPLTTCLPREWVPVLAEKAQACGIEFMCTPFSEDGLKFLDPYVKRHKIASSDLCHTPLLVAAAKTGKPIILSTGGHGLKDIQYALEGVLSGYKQITLLYCESSYPAYHTDVRKLDLLRSFGFPVGISDHSKEIYSVPASAKEKGCVIIEKHVNFVGATGPDAPHSLNLTEFKEMVDVIRGGNHTPNLISPYEVDMVTMHNRRLIATKDVRKGDKLYYDGNYGIYRSTRHDTAGMHPVMAPNVNGKTAALDIKQGDPIGPQMVEKLK
jgi:sialic acid synthase SpsE